MSSVRAVAKQQLQRVPVVFDVAKRVRDQARDTSVYRTAQRRRWIAARAAEVQEYLAGNEVPKLQLGSGWRQRPGWLNTDLAPAMRGTIYVDATEPLPFADATFAYVYSEHMIEHLGYDDACAMLRECRRILRPGGTLRVATPDLQKFMKMYDERGKLDPAQTQYVDWIAAEFIGEDRAEPVFVLNNLFRAWGHQFLYDEETLRSALIAAGFSGARRCTVGESADAHLRDLESHGVQSGSDAANEFETVVVEADRPKVVADGARPTAATATASVAVTVPARPPSP